MESTCGKLQSKPDLPTPCRQVQILSDLHLELGQQYSSYDFPASAPVLILGGDIGCLIDYDAYLNFLEKQTARFDRVFLVLGNHEFYGMTFEEGLDKAQHLANEPSLNEKLVLLHRSRWDDSESNLTILGCTLWSEIPQEAHDVVRSKITDYKKITDWTVEKHNQAHSTDLSWLRDQISQLAPEAEQGKRRLLVVTHHAPCIEGTSKPEYVTNPWTCAFATDLLDNEEWKVVKTWIFGHTHYSTDFLNKGIRLVANQRGYVLGSISMPRAQGQNSTHQFNDEKTIKI